MLVNDIPTGTHIPVKEHNQTAHVTLMPHTQGLLGLVQ